MSAARRSRAARIRGETVRTLQRIQIGTALAMKEHERRNAELGLEELDLQYQLPVEGTVTTVTAFTELDVPFDDYEFHYAPAQRDSELYWPHMTYGAHVEIGGPAQLGASVKSYLQDPDTDAFIGATLQISAVGQEITGVAFAGYLHVVFQGFAMSRDDVSDTPDLETGDDT